MAYAMYSPSGHASGPPDQSPRSSVSVARFQGLRFIGKGSHGFVQLAKDSLTGQDVAIKYVDRGWSRAFGKYVAREVLNHQSLSSCQHPHIVEFYEVFLTPRYLGVVMEYVQGMNLEQYLEQEGGRLQEDVARFVFQQLIIAVDFCHRKGKVNRDIKLANVMVAVREGQQLPMVKLCDFGFSKDKFDDSQPHSQVGTALFTAPEIFTNTQDAVYDGEAADVWSCGVVLYIMLFGSHPFLSNEDCKMTRQLQVMKLIRNSVSGNLQFPPESDMLQPGAMMLVQALLASDSNTRAKIPQILTQSWFNTGLPPGALDLNQQYLDMQVPPERMRQTPEQIRSIVEAAITPSSVHCSGVDTPESSAVTSQQREGSCANGANGPMSPCSAPQRHVQGMSSGMAQSVGGAESRPQPARSVGEAGASFPMTPHHHQQQQQYSQQQQQQQHSHHQRHPSGNSGVAPSGPELAGAAALRAAISRGGSVSSAYGQPGGSGRPSARQPPYPQQPLLQVPLQQQQQPDHQRYMQPLPLQAHYGGGQPTMHEQQQPQQPQYSNQPQYSGGAGASSMPVCSASGNNLNNGGGQAVSYDTSQQQHPQGSVASPSPRLQQPMSPVWPDPEHLAQGRRLGGVSSGGIGGGNGFNLPGGNGGGGYGDDSGGGGSTQQLLMAMLGDSSLLDMNGSLGLDSQGGNSSGHQGGSAMPPPNAMGGGGSSGNGPGYGHSAQLRPHSAMEISHGNLGSVLNDSSLLLNMDF